MKITARYSHLNGWEFIKVNQPMLWQEIEEVIASVDAEAHRTKISKEKTMMGEVLYSPTTLNVAFKAEFVKRGWKKSRANFWVTSDPRLIRKTLNLSPTEQRASIIGEGAAAYPSYNETDFVKQRIAVEVQFGKYFAVSYDMFVKHLAFYIGDVIDVGVEIMPMKALSAPTLRDSGKRARNMSTGVPWYEKELYNLIREGRGVPAVPMVLIGVAP